MLTPKPQEQKQHLLHALHTQHCTAWKPNSVENSTAQHSDKNSRLALDAQRQLHSTVTDITYSIHE